MLPCQIAVVFQVGVISLCRRLTANPIAGLEMIISQYGGFVNRSGIYLYPILFRMDDFYDFTSFSVNKGIGNTPYRVFIGKSAVVQPKRVFVY